MTIETKPLIAVVCIGDFGKRLIEKLRSENLGGISRYFHLERLQPSPDGVEAIQQLSEAFAQLDTVLIIDLLSIKPDENWLARGIAERAKELEVRPILMIIHRLAMPALIAKIRAEFWINYDYSDQQKCS